MNDNTEGFSAIYPIFDYILKLLECKIDNCNSHKRRHAIQIRFSYPPNPLDFEIIQRLDFSFLFVRGEREE